MSLILLKGYCRFSITIFLLFQGATVVILVFGIGNFVGTIVGGIGGVSRCDLLREICGPLAYPSLSFATVLVSYLC